MCLQPWLSAGSNLSADRGSRACCVPLPSGAGQALHHLHSVLMSAEYFSACYTRRISGYPWAMGFYASLTRRAATQRQLLRRRDVITSQLRRSTQLQAVSQRQPAACEKASVGFGFDNGFATLWLSCISSYEGAACNMAVLPMSI